MLTIFFRSKKDTFYSIVVWGTIAFVISSIVFNFSLTIFSLFFMLIGLITIGILIWLWFGTGYRIDNGKIKIQNGPFKWEVNIEDVHSLSKRKSLLATAALSIDRLILHYGEYGEMQLAPKNEKEFIKLLLSENSRIKLDEKITEI